MTPRFGRYEVVRELGRGGMGVVYLARDPTLGRMVAIKTTLDRRPATPRFALEMETLARVRHPNVVAVHEGGEVDGRPYIVLELVEGGSLSERIRNGGPLPEREAAALMVKVATAVDHLHGLGVLHRDLKPANVLLDESGEPKITDFGTVRLLDPKATVLSKTGQMIGTPLYMAPEQIDGVGLDARADIYALGATLFHMLTGEPPFRGDAGPNLFAQVILTPARAPSLLKPGLSAAIDAVCLRCLAKKPAGRYPTARALADDLARLLAGEATKAAAPRRARRLVASAVALVSLGALGAGSYAVLGGGRPVLDPASTASVVSETPHAPKVTHYEPAWFRALPAAARPDLPAGVQPKEDAGEYEYAPAGRPGDGSVFVWVPPGRFEMGADLEVLGEFPAARHAVTLTRGFFMGKYEVSWKQFEDFCSAEQREPPPRVIQVVIREGDNGFDVLLSSKFAPIFMPTSDHPVHGITWQEATEYCAHYGLRLPTEAEWEWAARGTQAGEYPWGRQEPTAHLVNRMEAVRSADPEPYTSLVTSHKDGRSFFGCLNMAGNVAEWVQDWYAPYPEGEARDPRGPATAARRVSRGGHWCNTINQAFAVHQRWGTPADDRATTLGFRVCLSGK